MAADDAEKWLAEHGFEQGVDNCYVRRSYARHSVVVWCRNDGWNAAVSGWTRRASTPSEAIEAAAAAAEASYAETATAVAEARAILGAT